MDYGISKHQTESKAWLTRVSWQGTDPVKHAVEQTRHHREDCGPQSFQVVHQKFDVSLEKADSASVDEDDALVRAHTVT